MKRAFVVGSLMLVGSSAAMAANTSAWDYTSVSLIASGKFDINSSSLDLKGYQLDTVKSLGTIVFLRAAVDARDVTSGGLKFDESAQQVSVGARFPLASGATPTELWGSVNYERVTLSDPGFVGTGPGVDVGIRSQATPQLDLNLAAKVHGDVSFGGGNDGKYTGYSLSAAYRFAPNISGLLTFSDYKLKESGGGPTIDFNSIVSVGIRLHY